MTTWNGLGVMVLGASVYGQPAHDYERPYNDCEAMVRIVFQVAGPIGPNDPPWGPQSEAVVPMSDLSGPVEYARAGGLMVTLR